MAPLKLAYVLQRFPKLSETFIMREMCGIRQHDVDLHIFSLLYPKPGPVHPHAKDLLPYVRYSSVLSRNVIKAQFHFIWNSPKRYLRALTNTVSQTYREPKTLLLGLALFPKSVYFAWQMELLRVKHMHAHFAWVAGIAAGIVSDLLGISFTVHVHAFDLFEQDQRDLKKRLQKAFKIVTVSEYNASYIRNMLPAAEVEIVRCGVDADWFRPGAEEHKGEAVNILSVGRLIKKKGHEYLVDACALLAERGLSFRCYIVGTGPLQRTLQARIDRHKLRQRVGLVGALREDRILELNQRSNIFALPCVVTESGDRDGLPVALIEAMACGLPVVSTRVTGIPELVDDAKNGLLVNERDVISLADALEKLIRDGSLRAKMGHAARQTVLDRFKIQDNTAKLAATFRQVSQSHLRVRPAVSSS